MVVIRITDKPESSNHRLLYDFLETIDEFSLYECRDRESLPLDNPTHTIVLDHIDEATRPDRIIWQVLKSHRTLRRLIIADRDEDFIVPCKIPLTEHLVYSQPQSHGMRRSTDRIYFSDRDAAAAFLFNASQEI